MKKQNANSLKNLITYKPGQSGNPKGKPKGTKSFRTTYKQYLQMAVDLANVSDSDLAWLKDQPGITARDVIVVKDIANAMKGSSKAIDRIKDTVDGKVVQKMETLQKKPLIIKHESLTKEELTGMDNFETNIPGEDKGE